MVLWWSLFMNFGATSTVFNSSNNLLLGLTYSSQDKVPYFSLLTFWFFKNVYMYHSRFYISFMMYYLKLCSADILVYNFLLAVMLMRSWVFFLHLFIQLFWGNACNLAILRILISQVSLYQFKLWAVICIYWSLNLI